MQENGFLHEVFNFTPKKKILDKMSSLEPFFYMIYRGYRYGVKQVTPLKDQKRLQKTVCKQPIAETVQAKSLNGVEAESEVKYETMEFDFKQSSMGLVNPTVCNSSDSFSDKNEVEEESPTVHLVCESSELFSDKEVVESSQSYSDKEIIEEALIAPTVSESSESFYDDAVLENEFDYNDEGEVSEEES
ncbi:hypothetical protein HanPI659440_Chr16g0645291 [Helianthus annuus]|nr:hypothetical protein HanPI659440_Chr16g0645291 [Helianthus annuus]